MEQGNDFLLQLLAEIDQQIATTDQVQPRERRILANVLLGKDQQVTNALVDHVSTAIGLPGKETRQALRRHVAGDARRITASARGRHRPPVDVGRKKLHRVPALDRLHLFEQQDGDRIGLLAGRASR